MGRFVAFFPLVAVVVLLSFADIPLAAAFLVSVPTSTRGLLLSPRSAVDARVLPAPPRPDGCTRRESATAATCSSVLSSGTRRRYGSRQHQQRITCCASPDDASSSSSSPLHETRGTTGTATVSPSSSSSAAASGGVAAAAAAAVAAAEGGAVNEFELESGAPWAEFEDWLLLDTYSRYVIGSGKHVLWRRMVREVPELMERSPREARQRWLRLTGRLEGGREDVPGSPPLNDFYLQPPVLEQWEEVVEADGTGFFRGKVSGQRGLADGTEMTTAPVDVSGRRIQDQYVATQCGVVYELGERRETSLAGQASSNLLKFAPATVLALTAAFYAFNLVSHHIQVEVFVI